MKNQVIIITGASSGFGRTTAETLAHRGIGGKPFGLPELRAIQAGEPPGENERNRHRRETT